MGERRGRLFRRGVKKEEVAMDERVEKRLNFATKIFRGFAEVSMWLLLIDAAIIIINIISRRAFNAPVSGATELVRYLMLACASFAVIENEWIDGNVSMQVFLEKMKAKTRRAALGVIYAFTTVITVIMSYLLVIQAQTRFFDGQNSNELHFPLWIPATVIAVCFCVLAVVLLIKTIVYFWMSKTGNEVSFRKFGEAHLDDLQIDEAEIDEFQA
jgi:TRAP-type C4-dicarboxylate transport system permease small subunit